MDRDLEALPLFPLDAVIFPYADIRLHVYEERYLQLVRRCVDEDLPFGVVLVRSGAASDPLVEPYLVGTAVRIRSVIPYDDGRIDVLARGQRRFRIRRLDDSCDYRVGYVEPVIEFEMEPSPKAEALFKRVRKSVRGYIEGLIGPYEMALSRMNLPADPVELSFVVANLLHVENLQKQRLLETTDTIERLRHAIELLEDQMSEAESPTFVRLTAESFIDTISPN